MSKTNNIRYLFYQLVIKLLILLNICQVFFEWKYIHVYLIPRHVHSPNNSMRSRSAAGSAISCGMNFQLSARSAFTSGCSVMYSIR